MYGTWIGFNIFAFRYLSANPLREVVCIHCQCSVQNISISDLTAVANVAAECLMVKFKIDSSVFWGAISKRNSPFKRTEWESHHCGARRFFVLFSF